MSNDVIARKALKLADRMQYHVVIRGGPALPNGAWTMMLEAASTMKILVARNSIRKPKRVKQSERHRKTFARHRHRY